MIKPSYPALVAAVLACTLAWAQDNLVLRDLDGAVVLTKEELQLLLPGASMARITLKGNEHLWKNEPGGSFIVSSDNRGTSGPRSSAQGKWQISDDGRYCVLMEWKTGAEEWCRYLDRVPVPDPFPEPERLGVQLLAQRVVAVVRIRDKGAQREQARAQLEIVAGSGERLRFVEQRFNVGGAATAAPAHPGQRVEP